MQQYERSIRWIQVRHGDSPCLTLAVDDLTVNCTGIPAEYLASMPTGVSAFWRNGQAADTTCEGAPVPDIFEAWTLLALGTPW